MKKRSHNPTFKALQSGKRNLSTLLVPSDVGLGVRSDQFSWMGQGKLLKLSFLVCKNSPGQTTRYILDRTKILEFGPFLSHF